MELITKYFPDLSERQKEQFAALRALYTDWNSKINVISRKDIDNVYKHHVLHSMAIAKAIRFRPGTSILDFGTGGGFPVFPSPSCFPKPGSSSLMAQVRKFLWPQRWPRLSLLLM